MLNSFLGSVLMLVRLFDVRFGVVSLYVYAC
jgi:hypothetical protein